MEHLQLQHSNFVLKLKPKTGSLYRVKINQLSLVDEPMHIVLVLLAILSLASHALDNAPQAWTNGYLIGVETMYFGGSASDGWIGDVYCSIVMECTSESLTQAAAMALALSQQ